MIKAIVTFAGSGLLKPAPGTWGSAAAIPAAWVIHGLLGFYGLLIATTLIIPMGWWATRAYITGAQDHDPSEVVIDEVAGMWIALLPLSYGMMFIGADAWTFPYPGWVTAFLAFRLFDIWKPGPVGWADRKGGAVGVMLDDCIAGLFAALTVISFATLAHLIFI